LGKLYRGLIKNIINPIYDFMRGTTRCEFGNKLEKTQWLPIEDINKIQFQNLKALLKTSYDSVPYYYRAFKERNIQPGDIKSLEDLLKLPVLTKQQIRDNKEELVNEDLGKVLIPSFSGGTGDQVKFSITKEQMSWEVAAEYRAYKWAGYHLGDKCANLWGSSFDISKQERTLKKITSTIERVETSSTYVINDQTLNELVKKLQKQQPEVVKGYASSVYFAAKKILDDDKKLRPRTVITSAESLLPHWRSTIEQAFGCNVFDYYGSREIGAMAAECQVHSGYHISAENVVLEFVKDGEHVSPGEQGEIIVTNLRNYGMPFIRYKIGDTGVPSDEACTCGRGLPIMKSIDGRISQFVSMLDRNTNKIIPLLAAGPGIIAKAMDQVPVENYRVLQEDLNKVTILVMPKNTFSEEHKRFVLDFLYDYVGKYIEVEVQIVNDLPPLPSGKRSVVISKINPFG
jgi:phenylacetate-CoA ligase